MDRTSSRLIQGLVIGLILLGVVARLVPHAWNVTPIMAIALFGGTYLTKRWAILLPLLIVAISDLLIGWHQTIPFTWGAFLLTGMIGWWIRRQPSVKRVFGAALIGSILFFLITNLGVWLVANLYPKTATGLWQCYVAALPFFRNTLFGNLAYTAALFGSLNLIMSTWVAREPAK